MDHSLNEIGSLCKRAARGAGLSWGLAEDAARGARWLSSAGLPGPRMLSRRLELLEHVALADVTPAVLAGPWGAASGRLCPLITGAAVSDQAGRLLIDRTVIIENPVCPLLIVPFAADAALELQCPISVAWNRIRLTTDGNRSCIEGDEGNLLDEVCTRLCCCAAKVVPQACLPIGSRGEAHESVWESLSAFASRTYAPATEESRRRGAGSGLADGS